MAVIPVKDRDQVFDVVVWTKPRAGEKRKRISKRVAGLRAAQKVERDLLGRRDKDLPITGASTVREFFDAYLAGRTGEVSRQTHAGYVSTAKCYIYPELGDYPLTQIDVNRVRKLYADMSARGLALRTLWTAHRVLSMGLAQAAFEGTIARNPCQKAKPRKLEDKPGTEGDAKPERGLEDAEVKRLLEDLSGTAVYVPCQIGLATGVRRAEMLSLKWDDVDLDAGVLHVRSALEQVGKVVVRTKPKTKRSKREIPLSPSVVAVLKAHKARQNERRLKLQTKGFWHDEGYVFPSETPTQSLNAGRAWTPNGFSQAWRKTTRAKMWADEGRPDRHAIGYHELRHTAATKWLRAGIRLEVVSRWLGHSSSVVTSTVYSHVAKSEQFDREGVGVFDALL